MGIIGKSIDYLEQLVDKKPEGNEAEEFMLKMIFKIVGVTAVLVIGTSVAVVYTGGGF